MYSNDYLSHPKGLKLYLLKADNGQEEITQLKNNTLFVDHWSSNSNVDGYLLVKLLNEEYEIILTEDLYWQADLFTDESIKNNGRIIG